MAQAILATDGSVSFAIFLYENPNVFIEMMLSLPEDLIGFNPGRRRDIRSTTITDLERVHIFRIDGKLLSAD